MWCSYNFIGKSMTSKTRFNLRHIKKKTVYKAISAFINIFQNVLCLLGEKSNIRCNEIFLIIKVLQALCVQF